MQRLIASATWDPDQGRDDLRAYGIEHLADKRHGVVVVDEPGFLKKGTKSAGRCRTWTI